MTVFSYHSTFISGIASSQGATYTTSSQIFLSRGVAGAEFQSAPSPQDTSTTFVTSIFESEDTHIMTLGDAAAHRVSTSFDGEPVSLGHNTTSRFPQVPRKQPIDRMSYNRRTLQGKTIFSFRAAGFRSTQCCHKFHKHVDRYQ